MTNKQKVNKIIKQTESKQNNKTLTYLRIEGEDRESAHREEEEEGNGNLDDVRRHDAETQKPVWEVMEVPRQGGWNTLKEEQISIIISFEKKKVTRK
jgi:hypothetical protein